jgi:hypothetical protein
MNLSKINGLRFYCLIREMLTPLMPQRIGISIAKRCRSATGHLWPEAEPPRQAHGRAGERTRNRQGA